MHYTVLIIGAGPSGMAAAIQLSEHGVKTLLVDEQSEAGGQIYRNVDAGLKMDHILGKEYSEGRELVKKFKSATKTESLVYWPNSSVWYLDKKQKIGILKDSKNTQVSVDYVLIATGAQERPMPFPGWQLPGVMMAGAAQILLKSSAMVADDSVVLMGNGPLLYLLACQYLEAGVSMQCIIDTSSQSHQKSAFRHVLKACLAGEYLLKGFMMKRKIKKQKIPWISNVSSIRAHGSKALDSVSIMSGGVEKNIQCSQLLIHQGVIPGLHMARSMNCKTHWNEAQQCWNAEVSDSFESSQSGIYLLGDGARIMGAKASMYSGQIAANSIAQKLGKVSKTEFKIRAKLLKKKHNRQEFIRPFIENYFRVALPFLSPPDGTIICRCEEVTAGEIRKLRAMGCLGPNQAKSFSRCGMGPCQGRFCAPTMEQIFTENGVLSRNEIGCFKIRPPLTQITLGQISD